MSSFTISSWAASAWQNEEWQTQRAKRAIAALESCLAGHKHPSVTAADLSSILDSYRARHGVLWGLICDAILVTGCDLSLTDRLIQLLDALESLPTVTDQNGEKFSWCQLPNLAWMLRDYAFEWYGLGMAGQVNIYKVHCCLER